MKKNSAFKLKSGNKPSITKLSGVMKQSPAKQAMNTSSIDTAKRILEPGFVKLNRAINKKKQTFTHSTNVPKGTKTRADGKLSNPVKTDPSGRYMTPKTNFKTKNTSTDGTMAGKPKTKDSLKKTTKKKVTFAEAYKKRDMKTYGNLNLKEYTAEAKRQIKNKKATAKPAKPSRVKKPTEMAADAKKNRGTGKGSGGFMTKPTKAKEGSWDAPKSQMKGSLKPADKTTKTKTTKKADLIVTKDAKKTQSVKEARAKRKEARKAVRTARKTSGRGSAEVKAAKEARKTARKNVRTAKKNRRATRKQTKSFLKN